VVQLLTPFSFVVVTLYMIALLVSDPMSLTTGRRPPEIPTPFYNFNVVAAAWCGYASFVTIQKMSSPYHSMSPCICVSNLCIPPLAAKLSIYSALCPMVSLLGDVTWSLVNGAGISGPWQSLFLPSPVCAACTFGLS
jgi:hypothetical protein